MPIPRLLARLAMAVLPALSFGPVSAQDWDGWYLGTAVEVSDYQFKLPNGVNQLFINDVPQMSGSTSGQGSGASLFIGRLWQRNALVYGMQLDLGGSVAGLDDPNVDPANPDTLCKPLPCVNFGLTSDLQTLGRFRAIVGLTQNPRFLVFGSLGIAAADFDPGRIYVNARGDFFDIATGHELPGLFEKRIFGPSFGLGAQYKLSSRLTLRGEVLHDVFRVEYNYYEGSGIGFCSLGECFSADLVTGNQARGSQFDIGNTSVRLSLALKF